MKQLYRLSLVALGLGLMTACQKPAQEEPVVPQSRVRTLHVELPDQGSQARSILVPQNGQKDFKVHWSKGDQVHIFCTQDGKVLDLGSFPLVLKDDAGEKADLSITFPVSVNLTKPYILYGVHGTKAKYTPIVQSSGGGRTSVDGLELEASPIIGMPLEHFVPPLYFRYEVSPNSLLYGALFSHMGVYEITHLENRSQQTIKVQAPHLSPETEGGAWWYFTAGANQSVHYRPSKQEAFVAALLDSRKTATEVAVSAGETRSFVSWYVPRGQALSKARVSAQINGAKQYTPVKTLAKPLTMEAGKAYHLRATWTGKSFTYGQVEELELAAAQIGLDLSETSEVAVSRGKAQRIDCDKPQVLEANLSADGLSIQLKAKAVGLAHVKVYSGSLVATLIVNVQEAAPKINVPKGVSISEDGTHLSSWSNEAIPKGGHVEIPSTVKTIGYRAFENCKNLKSITIPSSVTSIGSYAFYYCSSLTSVTIPNSVTSIGESAFSGCSSLTSVTIPSSVTSVANSAFSGCSSLTSVTIPSSVTSIGTYAFSGCSSLKAVTIPNSVIEIGAAAFQNCKALTSVSLPRALVKIENSTFEGCSLLSSVTLPQGLVSIGQNAFKDCEALTSISIPNNVASIGSGAFNGCKTLQSVTLPSNLSSIEENTFRSCARLSSITLPKSITAIEKAAFYDCASLTSIAIPGAVVSLGESAFLDCKSLRTVTLPNSLVSIGSYAFTRCISLKDITIPSFVKRIGSGAFMDCESLTSISIPNSVTYLDSYAFARCRSLRNVSLSNSLEVIWGGIFSHCISLTQITIPRSVKRLDIDIFQYCDNLTQITLKSPQLVSYTYFNGLGVLDRTYNLTTIYVPAELVEAYKTADYWKRYADKFVAIGN